MSHISRPLRLRAGDFSRACSIERRTGTCDRCDAASRREPTLRGRATPKAGGDRSFFADPGDTGAPARGPVASRGAVQRGERPAGRANYRHLADRVSGLFSRVKPDDFDWLLEDAEHRQVPTERRGSPNAALRLWREGGERSDQLSRIKVIGGVHPEVAEAIHD